MNKITSGPLVPVYRGRVIDVYKKNVRLSNGVMTALEVIEHPGAALIVPFLSADSVVALRQYRPVIHACLYELPAGTRNKGESTLSCARREIVEETGFVPRMLKKLGSIFPVPGYSTEKIVIYKATGLRKTVQQAEEDEVIRVCVLFRKQVKALFRTGKIVDAKTICAFALCGWL